MRHKTTEKTETPAEKLVAFVRQRRLFSFVAGALIVILLVLALTNHGVARHPNMAAFCKAYHTSRGADDLSDKVTYLRNLEKYAPNDIYPTIHKMRITYEQAQQQPSNYFGLEAGITGSIDDFNSYTSSHCDQN